MSIKNNTIVDKVDQSFAGLAQWAVDKRWLVVLMSLMLLAGGLFYTSKVQVDNSLDSFFNKADPAYIAYEDYLDEFLSDEVIYILYRVPSAEHGPFDLAAMKQIAQLTEALAVDIPFARKVTSLANVELIRAEGDTINVDELLIDFPETQAELLALKALVMSRPLYVDYLIDKTGEYAAIVVDMERSSVDALADIIYDPAKGSVDMNNLYPQVSQIALTELIARPEYDGIEFYLSGDVPLNASYNTLFMDDSAAGTLITLVVLAMLSMIFIRANWVSLLGPLSIVVLSLIMVMGTIGLFDWKVGMFFGIVPTLICAVGVAQSVHILLAFNRAYEILGDRRQAVKQALGKVGGACFLAALTTSIGFLVMVVSELKALSELGIYAAAGVMFTFILSCTLLVCVLSVGKNKSAKSRANLSIRPSIMAVVNICIALNLKRPKLLISSAAMVLILALAGIAQLEISFNFLTEFKPHVPMRQDMEKAEEVMGGILNVTYIVESDQVGGIQAPELLNAISDFQAFAQTHPLVKKAYSIADIQKDINRSFHGDDPQWYRIPDNRDLVAQYFLVYEVSGGDELENFVSRDYTRSVVELRVEITDSIRVMALMDELDVYLLQNPLPNASVRKSGIGLMWMKIAQYISDTQLLGYSLLFVMIALFLCVAFGSIKVGLLAMIPNVAPVMIVLGLMGWLGIHLDYLKLLLATIAISIAVDDTIHLVMSFRKSFMKTGSYEQAVQQSMTDVGPALIITTLILVGAFSCYLASSMAVIAMFGLLLSLAIVMALVADLLFMPALLLVVKPFGPEFDPAK